MRKNLYIIISLLCWGIGAWAGNKEQQEALQAIMQVLDRESITKMDVPRILLDDQAAKDYCMNILNISDGRHKMVVMTHRDYLNGEIAAGQYSGLSLYVYDAHTRRMRILSVYNQGIESPEINGVPVYTLSAEGKTITVSVNNPDEGSDSITYRWDGAFFSPICL